MQRSASSRLSIVIKAKPREIRERGSKTKKADFTWWTESKRKKSEQAINLIDGRRKANPAKNATTPEVVGVHVEKILLVSST